MNLEVDQIEEVIGKYLEDCYPAMMQENYHLRLAKGGPDYPHLPEQSLITHVLNGVLGLVRLVKFLVVNDVQLRYLDTDFIRKAIALYTLHDFHKVSTDEKLDGTEFSIPLEQFEAEFQKLNLEGFAKVDTHLMRAANVHKRSSRQGDLLLTGDALAKQLYIFVRIADTMASVTSPVEATSSIQHWLKNLGPEFIPKLDGYTLFWHQLTDIRGVLTNLIHDAVSQEVEGHGAFPLLFFSTGTIYIARQSQVAQIERSALLSSITDMVLAGLSTSDPSEAKSIAQDGIRPTKYDFQSFVYASASIPVLLDLIGENALKANVQTSDLIREERSTKVRILGKEFKLFNTWLPKLADVSEWSDVSTANTLSIDLGASPEFIERWSRTYYYLLYVDAITKDLVASTSSPKDRLVWLISQFELPESIANVLLRLVEVWNTGGKALYLLPIAYHFLVGENFKATSADALPVESVIDKIHQHTLEIFAAVNTVESRKIKLGQIGFRPSLTSYLDEYLQLSWEQRVSLRADALGEYQKSKTKSHKAMRDKAFQTGICSLCNRFTEYTHEIRTDVLGGFGRVFSNRVVPANEASGINRSWCPVCYLEFVFRKIVGLSLPRGADYGNSRRLYLYVLPTFTFTPEHLKLFQRWLKQFHDTTGLPVRDYGDAGFPTKWLEHDAIDAAWIEDVQDLLSKQAKRIGKMGYAGEQLKSSRIGQAHYYLIVWEKLAGSSEKDDARIATRTEAWAKATLLACALTSLSGCKIYVTEKPYLPVSNPSELPNTITFDSPPPIITSLFGDGVSLYGREKGRRSDLEKTLGLSASLWMVTEKVHAPKRTTKDKHISERLHTAKTNPLAGASFYKEYARLNDGFSPDVLLSKACTTILDTLGGDLVNQTAQLAEKCLDIALPTTRSGRGKARSYELLFRECIAAIREASSIIPDFRQAALTGQAPATDSIEELRTLATGRVLKGLERRKQQRRGDMVIVSWGQELRQLTEILVNFVIDELYIKRSNASLAKLLSSENQLAGGVFYHTDKMLSERWKIYRETKEARQPAEEGMNHKGLEDEYDI